MSRIYKFRAWDNHNKEWVYSNLMPDIGFWKWVAYDSTTVFNEWTGLKDREDVEIYEGDVVKTDGSRSPWIVDYVPPSFIVRTIDSGISANLYADLQYEVIGNIYDGVLSEYENPDIIEQYDIQNDRSPQKGNKRSKQRSQGDQGNSSKDRTSQQKESQA